MAVIPEFAVALPLAFRAVTATRSRKPRSTSRTGYVFAVAPVTLEHVATSASHRCHWYEKPVGLAVHSPSFALSVCPTLGVPEIVGGDVFRGPAVEVAGATTVGLLRLLRGRAVGVR